MAAWIPAWLPGSRRIEAMKVPAAETFSEFAHRPCSRPIAEIRHMPILRPAAGTPYSNGNTATTCDSRRNQPRRSRLTYQCCAFDST
jgi:hypothetical protein